MLSWMMAAVRLSRRDEGALFQRLIACSFSGKELPVMCEERSLLGPKSLNPLLWVNRPPFQHFLRQRRMGSHPPIIFKGDELLVEQRIDMRRQQQSVVAAEAFGIGGFAPGFDVTGDQQAGIGDAGDATGSVQQDYLFAEEALADASSGEL